MSEIPPAGTVGVILAFLVVGLIPKIPAIARLGVILVVGLGIYFGMSNQMFALPYADDLPMSDLFGGTGGNAGFAPLSVGILGIVLGVLGTVVSLGLQKLLGKKE